MATPKFKPVFTLTPDTEQDLLEIETVKTDMSHQPLTPSVLASMRELARLKAVHYSTMMAGNRLTLEEVAEIIQAHPRGEVDQSDVLRELNPKQRKVLILFRDHETVTTAQIATFFGIKQRSAANFCREWIEQGFLIIADSSKKSRTYQLAKKYLPLVAK